MFFDSIPTHPVIPRDLSSLLQDISMTLWGYTKSNCPAAVADPVIHSLMQEAIHRITLPRFKDEGLIMLIQAVKPEHVCCLRPFRDDFSHKRRIIWL